MTDFEIFKGDSANLDNVPIVEGQLIFTTDEGAIYLDINSTTRKQMATLTNGEIAIFNGGNANTLDK